MQKLYCVRDRKANLCHRPFVERDHVMAIRGFEQICQDPKSPMSMWPGEFELLHLGVFDDVSGKFQNLDMPLVLADGLQFQRPADRPSTGMAQT